MASITQPSTSRALAVQPGQTLKLVADGATDWSFRVNGGSWTAIASGVDEVVWTTPTGAVNHLTFDRLEVAIGSTSSPDDVLDLDLCEGPPAVLWVSDAVRNEAHEEPALRPWEGEDDDPPLGTPLLMPAANRDPSARCCSRR